MKYHKITVTMKNGFTYSYVCISKMLEGMKKASEGYWTEKVESVEITSEDYQKFMYVEFPKEEKVKPRREAPEKKSGKAKAEETKLPQFSSLENFFDSSEVAPKNKKLKKRV